MKCKTGGLTVLKGHTQFSGEEVNPSICVVRANREIADVAGSKRPRARSQS